MTLEERARISLACDYAMRFVGLPYIWGGNNPLEGFDCSGFVQEVLAAVGRDPAGDQTSGMLFQYFIDRPQEPDAGALAFYGTPERIIHVAFCLNFETVIEAGGGGRTTKTPEDASRQGAYVRVRPLHRRSDFVGCRMPDYSPV